MISTPNSGAVSAVMMRSRSHPFPFPFLYRGNGNREWLSGSGNGEGIAGTHEGIAREWSFQSLLSIGGHPVGRSRANQTSGAELGERREYPVPAPSRRFPGLFPGPCAGGDAAEGTERVAGGWRVYG